MNKRGVSKEFGISATQADWSREQRTSFWQPSRALLASIRRYQNPYGPAPIGWFRRKWAVLAHRFWSAVTAADIPLNCRIGGGLLIPHPSGIVIHPECRIGPNCLLFQQVTIGAIHGRIPDIGGHVEVGAGAKILGGISIGDHATIGANAVVLDDVPPGAIAVGVPARLVVRGKRSSNA